MVKNLPAMQERCRFNPWVRKILWRRKWQPTPVFLPREFHGQRSLVGYSPWGRKESDITELKHFLPSITVLIRDPAAYDLEGPHPSFVMLHPQHPALCLEYNKAYISQLCLTLGTPWTADHQAPRSMGFPRQEYWSGLSFSSSGDHPDPGMTPGVSCISGRSFIV